MSTLNQNIPPESFNAFQSIRKFYVHQLKDLEEITSNIQKVEDQFKDKQDQCESYLNQIKGKRRQNQKFGNLSKGVLQAKSQQIKSKTKNIQSVSSGIKEVVAGVVPQKLLQLKVNQQRALKKMFKCIYETIYNEKQQFDWETFKKLAIIHEGGEDLISRLVNYNFKQMPASKYDILLQLKADPQFQQIATKSVYSKDIIHLADWVDYVCLGHQFNIEKKRSEKEYEKIRRDVDKKSKGNLQVNQEFWKQTNSEIDKYQSQIRNIYSQLKTISFQMKKSLGDLQFSVPENQKDVKTQQIRA